MEKKARSSTIKPALVLFFLSPILSELLFGSTPVSRAYLLIIESLLYGSGALLIREFCRRYMLGWFSVILAGIAFGIIEECLLLQSAFNPHFLGLTLSFGRSWEVNWVWAEYIIGYHAIWSITIPILFTELLFPDRRDQPWLSKAGLWIMAGIYILAGVVHYVIFFKMSGFKTTWVHFSVAGLLALILIILSRRIPVKARPVVDPKIPSYILAGVIAFIASSVWLLLLGLAFTQGSGLPQWLVQSLGALIIVISLFLGSRWLKQQWNDRHRFALASGCLLASMFFGLTVLIQTNNILDIVSQSIFIVVTTVLLLLFRKRLLT